MDGWPRCTHCPHLPTLSSPHPAPGTAAKVPSASGGFQQYGKLCSTLGHPTASAAPRGARDWEGRGCPTPAASHQPRAGPQPVAQRPLTPPAAPAGRYADCQGTDAFPVSFFKRLNIKRLKCGSYFSVNVAAKYYHINAACKIKAIDNVISPGESLRRRITLVRAQPCCLCLLRSSAVHPGTRLLRGVVFPFAGLLVQQPLHADRSSPWVTMAKDGDTSGCLEVCTCFCGRGKGISPGREEKPWFGWSSQQQAEVISRQALPPSHPLAALSKHSRKNWPVCPLCMRMELTSRSELLTLGSASASTKKAAAVENVDPFFPPDVFLGGSAQALH